MGWDIPARVAMAPLLAWQAGGVIRTALRLPEADGPRDGAAGAGSPLRLLIVGDSSAAGVGVATQSEGLTGQIVAGLAPYRAVTWRLIARSGDTTQAAIDRVTAAEPGQFDIAVQALGVNDVTRGVPLAVWQTRQRRLHTLLRARFGVGTIIASGLPPVGSFPLLPQPLRWVLGQQAIRFDAGLAAMAARDPFLVHLPIRLQMDTTMMAPDGFHPGAEVYRGWGAALAESILALA
jgi:lysophospholipase L1-like esterase